MSVPAWVGIVIIGVMMFWFVIDMAAEFTIDPDKLKAKQDWLLHVARMERAEKQRKIMPHYLKYKQALGYEVTELPIPEEPKDERVKCDHCGEWGIGMTKCESCGAPVPPGPMYEAWLTAPRYMVKGPDHRPWWEDSNDPL